MELVARKGPYMGLLEEAEEGYILHVICGGPGQILEAYISRKAYKREEAVSELTRLLESEHSDRKRLKRDFINLKKQSFLDTIRGRLT